MAYHHRAHNLHAVEGPAQSSGYDERKLGHDDGKPYKELGTHHHLAVANFAQRSGVLWGDADRSAPLLGQAGVVKHQNAITHRHHSPDAAPASASRAFHPVGVGPRQRR